MTGINIWGKCYSYNNTTSQYPHTPVEWSRGEWAVANCQSTHRVDTSFHNSRRRFEPRDVPLNVL